MSACRPYRPTGSERILKVCQYLTTMAQCLSSWDVAALLRTILPQEHATVGLTTDRIRQNVHGAIALSFSAGFFPFFSTIFKCIGWFCCRVQKKYEIKGENSFTIRRACLPGCKERSTKDGSYTLCCTSNLCNGFSSSYVIKDQRWLLLAACLLSLVASLLHVWLHQWTGVTA